MNYIICNNIVNFSNVTFLTARGFPDRTTLQILNEIYVLKQDINIIYAGDHDPYGYLIYFQYLKHINKYHIHHLHVLTMLTEDNLKAAFAHSVPMTERDVKIMSTVRKQFSECQ